MYCNNNNNYKHHFTLKTDRHGISFVEKKNKMFVF